MGTNYGTTLAEEKLLPLAEALKQVAKEFPWMPLARLRAAVYNGEVPSRRSSEKKRARYYVRIRDLTKVVK